MKIKKYFLLLAISLLVVQIASASSLTRTFSKLEVLPGEEVIVNYSVNPANAEFWAVDEIIPEGWQVKETEVYKGHLKWYLTQTPSKTYTFVAPNEEGIYNFNEGSYQIYGDDNWYNFDPVKIEVIGECMTIYSPLDNNNYDTRRIPFNITLFKKFKYLKYVDLNDTRPRNRTLCRNCDEYGYSRKRTKMFKDGYHTLIFYAINDDELCEEQVSFFIDSKKPRIIRQEPRSRGYCNGNFKVKYTEEYLKNVYLYYGDSTVVRTDCPSGKNQECEFDVPITQYENQSINFHFEVEDLFWKIPYRRIHTCLVETITPHITNLEWRVDGRYLYLNITLDDEAKYLKYIDHEDTNPRERPLCSGCSEYGAARVRKKSFRKGDHDIEIIAEDEAGNRDTMGGIVFTV